MLFSNDEVSRFIRDHFAAAWENVRPVPVVEIDFGTGEKVKRTLNGNIATYICAPDGRIVDVIPGLNSPEAYLAWLRAAHSLYLAARSDFARLVPDHHRKATAKEKVGRIPVKDVAKDEVEMPHRTPGTRVSISRADIGKSIVEQPFRKTVEDMLLEADTLYNSVDRLPKVHTILSERVFHPHEITKRLYREVLHVDLDDPHLGLLTKAFNGGAYETR